MIRNIMIIALFGKPSSGKSTFFKASTLAEVEIHERPFTTLKSTEGVAYITIDCVDKEFNIQCKPKFGYCKDHKRFVPVKLMDVPGLIKGSHKGLGMGNQFLDDIRQADALIHIVDVSGSTNENGEIVAPGSYEPSNDIRFLEEEIDLWYYGILRKGWNKFIAKTKHEKQELHKALAKQLSGLKVDENTVMDSIKKLNLQDDFESWSEDELKRLASELRKKTKPMIIAANKMDLPEGKENYKKIKEEFPNSIIIPCSAESELALRGAAKLNLIDYIPGEKEFTIKGNINEEQKIALDFIKENVLDQFAEGTGVQTILNSTILGLLNHITIYPVATNKLKDKDGNILPDCLLVPEGTTSLELAFRIHSDIGNSFIRAVDLKTKKIIGKEHKLKNQDVIEIICGK